MTCAIFGCLKEAVLACAICTPTQVFCESHIKLHGRQHGLAEPDIMGRKDDDGKIKPIPMLLWCPSCGARHVDRGEFAAKPHHTHACQRCGVVWRPAIQPTVGVHYLPGFKDAGHEEMVEEIRQRPPWQDV